MQDAELLALYQVRDESAIRETDAKYGRHLRQIAEELLANQDAEEIVSDVLMQAWSRIPDEPPAHLFAYLAAVTRNLSMNRLDARNAKRRGGGKLPAVLDELSECVADSSSVEQAVSERLLDDALFLLGEAFPIVYFGFIAGNQLCLGRKLIYAKLTFLAGKKIMLGKAVSV